MSHPDSNQNSNLSVTQSIDPCGVSITTLTAVENSVTTA